MLLQAAVKHRTPSQACPWWARHFVVNRDLFRGAALCFEAVDPPEAWLFLIATQKPMPAIFLHLRRVDRVFHDLGGVHPRPEPLHRVDFDLLPWRCSDEQSIGCHESSCLFILRDMRFCGDQVFSTRTPESFERFIAYRPLVESNNTAARVARPQTVKALEKLPAGEVQVGGLVPRLRDSVTAEAETHIATSHCTKMETLICRAFMSEKGDVRKRALMYSNNLTLATKQQADDWLHKKLKTKIADTMST